MKIITRDEVKENNTRDKLWFVIHNQVYDVAKFMEEHPGGEEVLLEQAGKDASEIFDDVSHSDDAKNIMKSYLIGEVPEHERTKVEVKAKKTFHFENEDHSLSLTWPQWVIAISVATGVGLLVRTWFS